MAAGSKPYIMIRLRWNTLQNNKFFYHNYGPCRLMNSEFQPLRAILQPRAPADPCNALPLYTTPTKRVETPTLDRLLPCPHCQHSDGPLPVILLLGIKCNPRSLSCNLTHSNHHSLNAMHSTVDPSARMNSSTHALPIAAQLQQLLRESLLHRYNAH